MKRYKDAFETILIGVIAVLSLMGATLMIRASSLWSQEAAGWAQAIGSIVAIFGSYVLGERQAKATMAAMREADLIPVRRKNKAILALVDATSSATSRVEQAFNKEGFSILALHVNYDEKIMEGLSDALDSVPAHELGSFNSVAAFARLRVAMFHLRSHLKRAEQHMSQNINPDTGGAPNFQLWDTTALHMCCDEIVKCRDTLHEALDLS